MNSKPLDLLDDVHIVFNVFCLIEESNFHLFCRTILDHVAELALPPRVGVNGFEPRTVEEWLNALHLDEYLDLFHKKGYDTMDRIKQMWELELESVSSKVLLFITSLN